MSQIQDIPERAESAEARTLNDILDRTQDDAAQIILALGALAKNYGMSRLARETGLSRESLYKSLSGTRSPEFATILKILSALDLDLVVRDKPISAR